LQAAAAVVAIDDGGAAGCSLRLGCVACGCVAAWPLRRRCGSGFGRRLRRRCGGSAAAEAELRRLGGGG
jgi:hypothetical protein